MTQLGLGTVQFGMPYGIANRGARTPHEELVSILAFAASAGVNVLDTAAQYGDSETALGNALPAEHAFRIVTKTPAIHAGRDPDATSTALRAGFERSLENLKQQKLHALLVHDADELLRPGGDALWRAMDDLRRQGLVEKTGASVYTAAQIDALLARFDPTLVQVPVSIADQRLVESGHLSKLKRRGVEIHARSVLLQGLLLMDPDDRPSYFRQFEAELRNLSGFFSRHDMTPLEGALSFVSELEDVDAAVVGVTSRAQLEACLDAFRRPHTQKPDFSAAACHAESLLNPALWPASR
jgi:aryl-alcohol dehydrogenase-like predicted oxidoreductase